MENKSGERARRGEEVLLLVYLVLGHSAYQNGVDALCSYLSCGSWWFPSFWHQDLKQYSVLKREIQKEY